MIVQDLERKIMTAIATAIADAGIKTQIFGTWQPATIGYLKNQEEVDTVATITVALGTEGRETFSTSVAGFTGTVVLRIRAELDPAGDALIKIAGPLETLFKSWQASTYQQAFTALDVTGFKVGDITFGGGNTPALDFTVKTVTVDWPFTISGGDAD